MLNVITLFSGYDSQALALNRLGIPYDLAAWCEIDRHAITAHNALFPQWQDRNLGDVSKVDWAEWHKQHPQPIDLLTYSSPCQDFSSAGLQRGGEEGSGTRSGLLWETERAVRELRPRHLVFENVGGLVSDKFIDLFNRWQARLNKYGYTNFSQMMNAKDYGVPQNRLRIFMVSILDCQQAYYFPKPFPLERRLKDVLEQNVDERYYLSDAAVARLTKNISNCGGNRDLAVDKDSVARTLCSSMAKIQTFDNYIAEPQNSVMLGWTRSNTDKSDPTYHPVNVANCVTAAKRDNTQNYVIEPCISSIRGRADGDWHRSEHQQRLEIGGSDTSNSLTSVAKDNLLVEPAIIEDFYADKDMVIGSMQKNAYVGSVNDVAPCVNAACGMGGGQRPMVTEQRIRIRRLTERELYRLMDVSETDIDTLLSAPIPRTQHAKLAGNSIVVACLYYIFRNLFVNTEPEVGTQTTLF